MSTRHLIYAVEKNIRGGVTVYGENGVRQYFCRSAAKAVRAYAAQYAVEETIIQFKERRRHNEQRNPYFR